MFKRFRRPTAHRGRLSGHVARKLALCVFAATIILAALAVAVGYSVLRSAFIEGLIDDAEVLALTAIDAERYPTLDELVAAGERLVKVTEVAGGSFVNGIGTERARFGEAPSLTWAEARLEGIPWQFNDGHRRFEIFIGPDLLGISFGLLLSIDASARWKILLGALGGIALAGLVAALALAAATVFFARRLVCRPLGVVAAALEAAHAAPDAPAARLSRLSGDDELARLSRAVDQLLFYLAGLTDTELAPARAVVEQNPNAVLLCAVDGTLLAANRAALNLFGAADVDAVPGRLGGPAFLYRGQPTAFADLVAEGGAFGPGEVVLRGVTVPVLVAADVIRNVEGTPIGAFLMLVDVTDMVVDMRKQVTLRQEADRRLKRAEAALLATRDQLEACMVIMEHQEDRRVPRHPVAVDPRVTINAWQEEAAGRDDLAPDGLVCGELPLLRCDPGAARQLFIYALGVVHRRSAAERPTIIVTCVAEEEAARFTIRAGGERDGDQWGAIAEHAGDTTLLVAAIAALARSQGGRLVAERIGESGNGVTITLPLEPDVELPELDDLDDGFSAAVSAA